MKKAEPNNNNNSNVNQTTRFQPNLKTDKFTTIAANTSKLFQPSFMEVIRKVKDPILKEILSLIRKYSNTFEYIKFDGNYILNMSSNSISLVNQENLYNNSTVMEKIKMFELNTFKLSLTIIPKCYKEEIQPIKDDCLNVLITVAFYIDSKSLNTTIADEFTKMTFLNQTNFNLDPEKKGNKKLFDYMNLRLCDHIKQQENFVLGVNKFLNYLENFLPDILQKNKALHSHKSETWTQNEQNLLEKALYKYKSEPNTGEKFVKIGLYVGTKTGKQCLQRFKEIASKLKESISMEEDKRQIELERESNKESNKDRVKSDKDNTNTNINTNTGYTGYTNKNSLNNNSSVNLTTSNPVIKKDTKIVKSDNANTHSTADNRLFISDYIPEEINPDRDSVMGLVREIETEFSNFKTKLLETQMNKEESDVFLLKLNSKQPNYSNQRRIQEDEEEYNDDEDENSSNSNDFNENDNKNSNKNEKNLDYNNDDDYKISSVVNKNKEKDNNDNQEDLNNKANVLDEKVKQKPQLVNPKDNEFYENLMKLDEGGKSYQTYMRELKNPERYRFHANIKNSQVKHLESILLFSDKYTMYTEKFDLVNCVARLSPDCSIYSSCKRCRNVTFNAEFCSLIENPDTENFLYYFGTYCPKCFINMYIIISPLLLHESNKNNIANVFFLNCEPISYLLSSYYAYCINCLDSHYSVVRKIPRPLPFYNHDSGCFDCSSIMGIDFTSVFFAENNRISAKEYLSYLENYNDSQQFSNIMVELSLERNLKKLKSSFFRLTANSAELPDNGICQHYKHSYKWFRFSCCYKVYACFHCHSTSESCVAPAIDKLICGFCSLEQYDEALRCSRCHELLVKGEGTNYWEGGKGQTNKALLSSKDKHKYTGMNKTVSNKQKDKAKK